MFKNPTPEIKKLVLKRICKKGITKVRAKLTGLDLPADVADVGLSLRVGGQTYHGRGELRTKGRKVVFP
jgi:hypothetical protein